MGAASNLFNRTSSNSSFSHEKHSIPFRRFRPISTNTGFTLSELLIVVAIIAVLVAIAIPVFTNQLEKSREATDLSRVRNAYAEVMYAANTEDKGAVYNGQMIYKDNGIYEAIVPLKQKIDGWATNVETLNIGGVPFRFWQGNGPMAEGNCYVTFDSSKGETEIFWDSIEHKSGPWYGRKDYPTEPSQTTQNNKQTAETIGNTINTYLKNYIHESAEAITEVYFYVYRDGTYSIHAFGDSIEYNPVFDSYEDQIIRDLTAAGLLDGDKATFEGNDPYYSGGYEVFINVSENTTEILPGEIKDYDVRTNPNGGDIINWGS